MFKIIRAFVTKNIFNKQFIKNIEQINLKYR